MRILVLLNNSYTHDSRVERLIKTLSSSLENKILLLCTHKDEPKLKKIEVINNVTIRRKSIFNTFFYKKNKKVKSKNLSKRDLIFYFFQKRFNKAERSKKLEQIKSSFDIFNFIILIIGFFLYAFLILLRKSLIKILRNTFWFFETEFYNSFFYNDGVKFKPDVIHCNDLSTLEAGYSISKKCNSKLIYDSHELELDRNSTFNIITKYKRYLTEKFLIKRCNHVITVSESIANYLKEFYNIPKPSVIYNSPDTKFSNANFKIEKYVKDWQFYKDKKIIIYIGLVTVHRGIEQLLDSYKYLGSNFCILILGPVNTKFTDTIKEKYQNLLSSKSILFIPPVKKELVTKFVSYADVSILPIQNICKSYNFCFPNKLLESVYSNIPVAVSNLTELSIFVNRYKCGLVFDEKDPFDIAKKIKLVASNKSKYLVSELDKKEIDKIYSAESQHERLLEIYRDI